jgi:hypothetical protein
MSEDTLHVVAALRRTLGRCLDGRAQRTDSLPPALLEIYHWYAFGGGRQHSYAVFARYP